MRKPARTGGTLSTAAVARLLAALSLAPLSLIAGFPGTAGAATAGAATAGTAAAGTAAAGTAAAASGAPARSIQLYRARVSGPARVSRPARRAWRPVNLLHAGAAGNLSGYAAVLAPARHDAWAFGGTNPGGPGAPLAAHWTGRRWQQTALPAGLTGFIVAASASSARDIWAVSYFGRYVLRWNGRRWVVAHTWPDATAAASVLAISRSDVWVFGGTRFGAWHYDGRSWTRQGKLAARVYRVSAAGRRDIWALADAAHGAILARYNGRRWHRVATGSALAGARPAGILAISRRDVWVAGTARKSGHLIAAHWTGDDWSRFTAPWQAQPERFAADGTGGIWIPTVTGALTQTRWILHLTASGHWRRTALAAGPGASVSGLAPIPGTRSVWASGGVLRKASGYAAIWVHGPVP